MVYFLQLEDKIKIGHSNNPSNRFKDILPDNNSKVIFIEEGDFNKEQLLHRKFKESHLVGEWFNYSEEIKDYIISNSNLVNEYKFPIKRKKRLTVLSELRNNNNYTMAQVAEKLDIKVASVSDMEENYEKGVLGLNTLKKYLDAIGYDYEINFIKKT